MSSASASIAPLLRVLAVLLLLNVAVLVMVLMSRSDEFTPPSGTTAASLLVRSKLPAPPTPPPSKDGKGRWDRVPSCKGLNATECASRGLKCYIPNSLQCFTNKKRCVCENIGSEILLPRLDDQEGPREIRCPMTTHTAIRCVVSAKAAAEELGLEYDIPVTETKMVADKTIATYKMMRGPNANNIASEDLNRLFDMSGIHGPLILLGGSGGSGSRGFAKLLQDSGVIFLPSSNTPLDYLIGNVFSFARLILPFTNGSLCYDLNVPMSKRLAKMQRSEQLFPLPAMASLWLQTPYVRSAIAEIKQCQTQSKPEDCPTLPGIVAIKHGPLMFALPTIREAVGPNRKIVFIHYVRDGRDMAMSENIYQMIYTGKAFDIAENVSDVTKLALLWAKTNLEVSQCFKKGQFGPNFKYVRVRFEDFVTSNRETRIEAIKKLFLTDLGITPFAPWETLASVFDHQIGYVGKPLEFNGESHEHKWMKTPEAIKAAMDEPIMIEAMKEFGYLN